MDHYFLHVNGIQKGPFTLDEMKTKKISPKSQVWKTGMSDWTNAENIDEVRPYLILLPPPLKRQPEKAVLDKFDRSYEKNYFATYFGIVLVISFFVIGIGVLPMSEEFRSSFLVGNVVLRIVITIWVVSIASEQNRSNIFWGIFSFILPSIALIIIGLLPKLNSRDSIYSKYRHSKDFPQKSENNDTSLSDWREKNPKKSLNEYYMELNNSKK